MSKETLTDPGALLCYRREQTSYRHGVSRARTHNERWEYGGHTTMNTLLRMFGVDHAFQAWQPLQGEYAGYGKDANFYILERKAGITAPIDSEVWEILPT